MALSDKNIIITPNTGVGSPTPSDPSIVFSAGQGSPDGALDITLFARPQSSGTLSFEGTAGQLFSITNDLTGTIFSVNDISGIPSIEVEADGTVRLAEFDGNVGIGTGSPAQKLSVVGTVRIIDTGKTDYVDLSHDGTDFNAAFTNTADWNITGLSGRILQDAETLAYVSEIVGASNAFGIVTGDTGTIPSDKVGDTVQITGGTSITTSVTGSPAVLVITNDSPNTDQNLWLNMDADSGGPVAANTTSDTFTITGGTGITTAISGDAVTITQDTITLGTNTAGDFVGTITGGTGIDSSGATSGEDIDHTLSVNLGEVTAVVFVPADDYIPIIDGSATGTTQKDQWADIATLIAGSNITATAGVLSVAAPGDADQNLFLNVLSDSGTAVADTTTDTLSILGGTGISTAVSADALTITNDSPNVDQNLWEEINADTGTTTANTTADSLTIAGGQRIQTSISGDILTIAVTGSPNVTPTDVDAGTVNGQTLNWNNGSSKWEVALELTTRTNGINVVSGGNANPVTPDVVTSYMYLQSADANDYGRLGYNGSINMELLNWAHGGNILIRAEDASGSLKTGFDFDPDGITTTLGNYIFDIDQSLAGADNYVLTYDSGDGQISLEPAAAGTVTSVSVVSANGLAGTVATATTTPAITLTTSINAPALAGNGTAISAATTTGSGSTVVLSASPTLTGTVAAANINLSGEIQFNGTEAITATGGLLEINAGSPSFVSGVYCPTTSQWGGMVYVDTNDAGPGIRIGDGDMADQDVLLNFNTDRPWSFIQDGNTGTANLALKSLSTGDFVIQNSAGTDMYTFDISGGDIAATSFNSVPLNAGGAATNFLNEAGGYTVPAGGGGGSPTTVDAVNIGGGNLDITVLPYAATSSTSSAFKVPFLNTTASTSGNYGLLQDSTASFTYNPSTNTITASAFSGATTAATIAGGNLGSGVLPYATASATSSSFRVPFLNTTGNTSGNYGLLHDSTGTFTYNPNTDTLGVINITATGDIVVNTGSVDVDQDEKFFSTRFDLYNTNSDVILHNKGTGAGADTFFTMNNSLSYEGLVIRNLGAVELYHADSLKFQTASHLTADGGTGADVVDGTNVMRPVGFNAMPVYEIDVADTFDLAHVGMLWHKDTASAVVFTCAVDTTIPLGAMWMVQNEGAGAVTIVESSPSNPTIRFLFPGSTPTTGTVTVDEGGIVSVYKYTDSEYWVWGANTSTAGGVPTTITIADESADTACFPMFATDATGDVAPKSGTNLTFNSNTGLLTATSLGGLLTSTQSNNITVSGIWTLDAPVTATDFGTGGKVKDGIDVARPIGFNVVPVYEIDAADTFDLAHNGMMWHKDAGAAVSFTCANDAFIPQGATYLVHNDDTEDLTIAASGVTIYFLEPGAAPVSGNVTVEQGGIVTVYKYSDTEFWVWGSKSADAAALITVADESSDTTCFPIFSTDATGDIAAKTGTNLTFNSSTGLLSSTAMTTTGDMTADNFEATGLGPNTTPGTDDAYIGGYGLMGSRATFYVSNVAGDVAIGVDGVHNANVKLLAHTTGVTVTGDLDLTGGSFFVDDSESHWVGTGNDARLYFNATNTLIDCTGAANNFFLRVNGSENALLAAPNGAVTLYHNAIARITTTVSGAKITDSLYLDEQAAANANVTGDGQIWVKTATPNNLYFTTDNGVDYPVGYGTYRKLTDTTLDNINVTETIGAQHINGVWVKSTTTARTLTLELSGGLNFPVGSQLSIYNRSTTNNMTVTDSVSQALWLLDGTTAVDTLGGVTIGPGGYATLIRESTTVSVIMGANITNP